MIAVRGLVESAPEAPQLSQVAFDVRHTAKLIHSPVDLPCFIWSIGAPQDHMTGFLLNVAAHKGREFC